jgi:hypothetical protein
MVPDYGNLSLRLGIDGVLLVRKPAGNSRRASRLVKLGGAASAALFVRLAFEAPQERLAMPIEEWVQHCRVARFLHEWQTLAAGLLALLAAVGTIWATRSTASRQIKAARKEADRVIAAAREQTSATFDLARRRDASEAFGFYVMLEAAMARVLAEAARAKRTYLPILTQTAGLSLDGLVVRRCITKGAFAELRAACVRRGGDLTGEFLDLEREIDSFASQYEDRPTVTQGVTIRMGKLAGLDEQLASIERKADALREKAFERVSGSVAAPSPFSTSEAEALIGTLATPISEPRRSWLRWWFGWRAG